ncbi:unnamed protein product [Ectocarpus sp. 12 AP-2014]
MLIVHRSNHMTRMACFSRYATEEGRIEATFLPRPEDCSRYGGRSSGCGSLRRHDVGPGDRR